MRKNEETVGHGIVSRMVMEYRIREEAVGYDACVLAVTGALRAWDTMSDFFLPSISMKAPASLDADRLGKV